MREEKTFSGEKKECLQVAPNRAALKSLLFFGGGLSLDVTELSY